MHIKRVILLGIFSFGLRDVVNLSTTFFIQRFFTFFYFFIKTRFLTFFILGVNVFLHLWSQVRTDCSLVPYIIHPYLNLLDRLECSIEVLSLPHALIILPNSIPHALIILGGDFNQLRTSKW